jgi:hypothetical protein
MRSGQGGEHARDIFVKPRCSRGDRRRWAAVEAGGAGGVSSGARPEDPALLVSDAETIRLDARHAGTVLRALPSTCHDILMAEEKMIGRAWRTVDDDPEARGRSACLEAQGAAKVRSDS